MDSTVVMVAARGSRREFSAGGSRRIGNGHGDLARADRVDETGAQGHTLIHFPADREQFCLGYIGSEAYTCPLFGSSKALFVDHFVAVGCLQRQN
jgi:hypothetical protein